MAYTFAQVIVGTAWEYTIPFEICVSTSTVHLSYCYIIATLTRTGRYCIALDGVALQFRI